MVEAVSGRGRGCVIVLPADPCLALRSFRPYATPPKPASRVGYDSAVGRNTFLLTGN